MCERETDSTLASWQHINQKDCHTWSQTFSRTANTPVVLCVLCVLTNYTRNKDTLVTKQKNLLILNLEVNIDPVHNPRFNLT